MSVVIKDLTRVENEALIWLADVSSSDVPPPYCMSFADFQRVNAESFSALEFEGMRRELETKGVCRLTPAMGLVYELTLVEPR